MGVGLTRHVLTHSFNLQAQSVPEAPMPVKYSLIPFYDLDIIDETSYKVMFKHYSIHGSFGELDERKRNFDDNDVSKGNYNLLRKFKHAMSDFYKVKSPHGPTLLIFH